MADDVTTPVGSTGSIPGTTALAADPPSPAVPRRSRRRRGLGLLGQAVGVAGIVVALVLAIGTIAVRGWVVDRVAEAAGAVDGGAVRATQLVDRAQAAVGDVAGEVAAVTAAAEALAADPASGPAALQALLERVNGLSQRYLGVRAAYGDVRADVVSALDRLALLDRLVPVVSVPQGPVDALATVDARLQALDERVVGVLEAGVVTGAAERVATGIADRSRAVEELLGSVTSGLDAVEARLDGLRAEVAAAADRATLLVTLAALVAVLLFLYLAFLHVVLLRASRGVGRAPR